MVSSRNQLAAILSGLTEGVIAVDLDQNRLDAAKDLGADVGLKADEVDVAEEVKKLTGGRGADVALEVVGATATIDTAIDCLRKGGALTMVGNLAPRVEVPLQKIVTRELTLLGSCASCGEYPACIELMRTGAIQVAPLITATASLDEGPDWFSRLYAGEKGAMKVIIQPSVSA